MQHRPSDGRGVFAPEEFLAAFLTNPTTVLADIGCGPGYFALPAARMLPAGRVLAVDLQQQSLDILTSRAQSEGILNIDAIRADAAALPFPDASVDAVLMARFLNSLPQRDAILREALRVLRGGGRLFLVQWDRVETPMGPPFAIRIGADEMQRILASIGFELERVWPGPEPFYRVLARKP